MVDALELPATCAFCGEGPFQVDNSDPDIEATWQQWRCPACGAWNDRRGRIKPADRR